jgi:aspartate/methionine/tyrosine aminotransferase
MPRFPSVSDISQRMSSTSYGPFATRMNEMMQAGTLIPLHLGDSYLLPPKAARQIDLNQEPIHRYAPIAGLPKLRAATCERLVSYGIDAAVEDVFITPGSTGGLSLAVEAMFDPGDEVIVLTPSWPLIFGMLQRRAVTIREVPVGLNGSPDDLDAFKERLNASITEKTAAIYFCDPNNPAGFIYSKGLRQIIAEIVDKHELWVISDIAYADMAFNDDYRVTGALPEFKDRCVTSGTYSKTFALAGHRVGYLHAPQAISALLSGLITNTTYHTSTSAQAMALACLESGQDDLVAKSYKTGADIAHELFKGCFQKAQGGAFLFVDLRPLGVKDHQGTLDFLLRCLDKGVSLCPGQIFGQHFGPFARLCYTAVSPERLREGLALLNPLFEGDMG